MKTANSLHPNLEFTIEHETNSELAFLDLLVTRSQNKFSTSWYTKPSDTGVYLSSYACAPTKYKRNIVEGAIQRIHHTTSNWANFGSAVSKLTTCLEANQYHPSFYSPLIRNTIENTLSKEAAPQPDTTLQHQGETRPARNLFVTQYRGRISDQVPVKLKKMAACSF